MRIGDSAIDLCVGTSVGGVRVTPSTLFPLLCAGKPFTSVALACLVEKGLLSYGDDLGTLLPGVTHLRAVTVDDVLRYRAGLPLDEPFLVDGESPESTLRDIDAWCGRRSAEGGLEDTSYSPSWGWFLLGQVIERVSGSPPADVIRHEVLAPLDIETVSLGPPWPSKTAGAEDAPFDPGRGVRATAGDLVTFYRHLVGTFDAGKVSILAVTALEDLLGSRCDRNEQLRSSTSWNGGFEVGRAVARGRHGSRMSFGTCGFVNSSRFVTGYADPAHDLAVAIGLTSLAPPPDLRIRALSTAIYEDLGLAARA